MDKFKIKIKAIVKCEDKVLLVKKWYDDRISEPYQWECLDGDMMFGESPDIAAERIVRDQTQLEVSHGKLIYTWSYTVGDICYVGICYSFESVHKDVFLSEELLDYRWATKEELSDYPMNDRVRNDMFGHFYM